MNKIKFGIGKRFLLLNAAMLILSLLVLGVAFFEETKDLLVDNELDNLKEGVELYTSKLQAQISSLEENVLLLSKTPPVMGIIRAQKNKGIDPSDGSSLDEWNSRLIQIFSDFLAIKSNYISLRFIGIGEEGREIIRVDKIRNSIKAVREGKLQSKGDRPYFKEAIQLESGQVYLSEINLNQENHKISRPYTPVIRAATPVHDLEGNPYGIIIANLDANRLLKEGTPRQYSFYVTNHKGYFLSHPNPNKTFGFDLGYEWKIQEDLPETAVFFDPDNPIQEETLFSRGTDNTRFTYFAKLKYDRLKPHKFLGVGLSEDYESLMSGASQKIYKYGSVVVGVVLASLSLTGLFVRRLTRPLRELTLLTEDLAQGKTGIEFPTQSGDELAVLAKSLESMDQKVKERTAALSESLEQNRSIMENVVDGLITIDSNGIVQTFNPAAEKIFGYSSQEAIGQNVSRLMNEKDGAIHDGYIANYLNTWAAKIIGIGREVVGRRKNGTLFQMDLSIGEIQSRDNEGNLIREFIGTCRNIEDRKRTERALEEANERNENILNAAGEGIFGLDMEGNVSFINPSGAQLLGFEGRELIGKNMHQLVHYKKCDGSLYPIEECPIFQAFKGVKVTNASDESFWKKDGSPFPVEFTSNPVYEGKNIIGVVVTFNDITDRKESELKLLAAKEEAEKASAAKTEFLSRMSHELRTPLNAILGFSQLELLNDNGSSRDEVKNENVQRIMDSGTHLLRLVNEILDLSQIESGKLSFDLEPVELGPFLNEVYSQCKLLGKGRNIALELESDKNNGRVFVNADRVRLKQVLLNLISNGIKYNREDGTTGIFYQKMPGGKVRISVRDQGKGIPPEKQEFLFTPFDRLDAAKTEVEGAGVGLAISKQLTELMGGSIGFNSVLTKGSEFYVEFATLPSNGHPF